MHRPFTVAASPDGSMIYALVSGTDTLAIIDTSSNKVVDSIQIVKPKEDGELVGIAVAPDGKKLYLNDNGSNFNIADVEFSKL